MEKKVTYDASPCLHFLIYHSLLLIHHASLTHSPAACLHANTFIFYFPAPHLFMYWPLHVSLPNVLCMIYSLISTHHSNQFSHQDQHYTGGLRLCLEVECCPWMFVVMLSCSCNPQLSVPEYVAFFISNNIVNTG